MNISPPWRITMTQGGYFLMRYEVWLQERQVGEVSLETEGRFYILNCKCFLPSTGIYKLMALTSAKNISIGTLIPEKGEYLLKRSIPMHKLESIKKFCIERVHTQTFMPVTENDPITFFDKMEMVCYHNREGIPGILIKECLAQGPQDSDPTPKYLNGS